MKVIIPVAGVGNRLKPHTYSLPKPLLRVAGRPVLAYILDPLLKLRPDEVVFVIGFKGEQIIEYISENFPFKATFVNQVELRGLGYAVHLAMEKTGDEPVLIVLGDTIVECDLEAFVAAGDSVLGVRKVEDPSRFGVVGLQDGAVRSLEEKPVRPKSDLALIGLYYFQDAGPLRRELKTLVDSGKTTNGEIQLTDGLAAMLDHGAEFVPHEVEGWYDCGKKETLLATNQHLLEAKPPPREIEGSLLIPPVYVSDSAKIVNSVIGPDVSISDNAVIVNSVIKNTIIGAYASVENVVLEDSLLGRRSSVKGRPRVFNIGDSSQALLG